MVVYGLISLLAMVYALVELARTPADQVRTLPKPLWFPIVFLLTPLGPAAWLLFGRPRRGQRPAVSPPARPIAPDDDEDFLRDLRRRTQDPRDDAA